ncbi:MAG TPA: glutamate formimidoyltransferase [Chloroflexi bacterium]|nr:glutamate formimidoyltransferase [Chloroflexota bacterium]
MKPLVECVPNFSEGRRPEVIEEIVEAIRRTPGVALLDVTSDADHNRSVVTFVGSPESVERAAFEAIKTAARLIDMTQHTGEHPRIGATDVVPFVPIRGVSMEECVRIAHRVGQRVGEELGIPVYLYEYAATRPERRNLENIRRGEYEGLREAIRTDPDRAPDYGPAELGTAGATVIGARAPLIAYNLYLNTDDVEAARRIARAVRHSSGGLRFVKALGLLVEGRAQVSMNLTDYTRTPVHRVQELVRIEAARYGYQIAGAELIGLIPEQALVDAARWHLQLERFREDQILEWRLQSVEAEDISPDAFLEAVASGEPTPGGGSVAALSGALAAALAAMVARTTIGKKKYADVEATMQEVAAQADELRARLSQAINEDSEAFREVMAAYRLPGDDPSRTDAIQNALRHAAEVPLQTARLCLQTLEQLRIVAGQGNINAVTDAATGVHMAWAAIESALLNVAVNIQGIEDQDVVRALREEAEQVRGAGHALVDEILTLVRERAGLS